MYLELGSSRTSKMMDYHKQAHHQQHLHRLLTSHGDVDDDDDVVISCQPHVFDDEPPKPDSPIDLSQLSTRRPADRNRKRARLEEMVSHLKTSQGQQHHADQSSPLPTDEAELLRYRCLSDSRLATAGLNNNLHGISRDSPEEMKDENAESSPAFLRRTMSESLIGSRMRSPDMTAAALELMKRQQQLMQEHYGQLVQNGTVPPGAVPNGSDPAYLSAALQSAPWLYLGLFGYSHILQSFQAQEYLRQMASAQSNQPSSGQVSAGPNSPVPSPSGSDEASDPQGSTNGSNQKRRSPRALTGKHVRLGTGASPTTLQTLRMKIEERQKLKLRGSSPPWSGNTHSSSRTASSSKKNSASKSKKRKN